MSKRGTISVYKNDNNILKIEEQELSFTDDKDLPCFCKLANGKRVAVAREYIKDEKAYLVDMSINKIFACTSFKTDELPTHIGEPIYLTQKGVLTGKKESNIEVGDFLGLQNGVVLFNLI